MKILLILFLFFYSNYGFCRNFGTEIAQIEYSDEEAARHLAKALYKDSELEKYANKTFKKYKKKVPDSVMTTIKYGYPLTELLINGRIQYRWEF